jgi:hypothetical protein
MSVIRCRRTVAEFSPSADSGGLRMSGSSGGGKRRHESCKLPSSPTNRGPIRPHSGLCSIASTIAGSAPGVRAASLSRNMVSCARARLNPWSRATVPTFSGSSTRSTDGWLSRTQGTVASVDALSTRIVCTRSSAQSRIEPRQRSSSFRTE